ncbi:MAG TPA: DNA mismatch repair endonuclease MutL [Clostridiaceae bacterium]|nr:DNA mismatch repair endonuclease MutL [Clostridiaceae bacterium]
MSKIVILDENTANQIAAGEVIERPASVVKEMVENSIDAGATQITVEIRNGGISYIRVTDNGSGIEKDDLEFAFERHATSKIRRIEDLEDLSTMGFRGEALASIASVSQLEVTSKTEDALTGTTLKMEGGRVISIHQTGSPKGTSFIVRNLFYNTPARYKFLKRDSTEAGYISDIIQRLALANPGISFKFIQNNRTQLHTPGNHDLLSVIYSIFGKDIAKSVLPVSYKSEGFVLEGFIGKPEIARGNRNNQSIFLNGRYIKSKVITKALEDAYKTMLMQNKFPFCVLHLKSPAESYDVNVHPQKLEVRFVNESSVYSAVYHGVKGTLLRETGIREFEPKTSEIEVKNNPPVNIPLMEPRVNRKTRPETSAEFPKQSTLFDRMPEIPVKIEEQDCNVPGEIEKKCYKETHYITENEIIEETKASQEIGTLKETIQTTEKASLQELLNATIVGQVFDTYILLQCGNNLYIIDQHAAHERIRYEYIKQRHANNQNFSQIMLEPVIIKLTANEYDFVMEKQSAFQSIGFEIEAFGSNTVIIRSIPDFYENSFSVSDFNEILDRWIQTGSAQSDISDETLYMISCKGALKANRPLSKEEILGLIENLCALENPYTCVHGRPVILTMEKKEFEKRFKRIL